MEYQIKTATINDINWIIHMAEKEGWQPGLYDANTFYQADPTGFYIGYLNDKPISCISAVKYKRSAFVGLYIVDKNYRHQGYGYQIWQYALSQVNHLNLGLDGVVEQQSNYQKSGFKLAYRNIRFQGKINKQFTEHSNILLANLISFNHLADYDHQFFLDHRNDALAYWLTSGTQRSLVYLENGIIKGLGSIRPCVNQVYKIGPLFADRCDIAEALILALSHDYRDFEIIIDCPEPNKNALQLAEKLNLKPSFETARMYTKTIPNTDLSKVYGISTFELG